MPFFISLGSSFYLLFKKSLLVDFNSYRVPPFLWHIFLKFQLGPFNPPKTIPFHSLPSLVIFKFFVFFLIARGYSWTPKNQRPQKLRDSLKELEVPASSIGPSSATPPPSPLVFFLPLGIFKVFPFRNGRLINK